MASVPKSHGSVQQFNKIPILGLVAETAATGSAPASPVNGQLWYDSTLNRLMIRENSVWVLASQTGAVLSGAAAGGDLTGTYPNPTVAALAITDAKVAAANKDGVAGTASMRTLGTGAQQAASGTDARLSDTRVPTDGSVTGGTAGAGVKIAATTITAANIAASTITDAQVAAANKDGVAGTASMRTLGTTSVKAMPGNSNLNTIASANANTAHVAMGGFKLTGLGAPTATDDAARLVDVQNAQAGIDLKPSVRVASTVNLTLSGTQTIDGVAVIAGDRVLVKDQTTTTNDGIYVVAAGAWARSSDDIGPNALVLIEEGTVSGDTSWMMTTNAPFVLGTTAQVWSQFGAGTTPVGTSNRITVTGSTIDIAATYVGQGSITTLGTITTGTWNGTDIAVADGGTGASTATAARTNLGAVGKYTATLGALVAGTETVITHSLGSDDVITQFRRASDDFEEILSWRRISTTQIGVTADMAYAASAIKVVVLG